MIWSGLEVLEILVNPHCLNRIPGFVSCQKKSRRKKRYVVELWPFDAPAKMSHIIFPSGAFSFKDLMTLPAFGVEIFVLILCNRFGRMCPLRDELILPETIPKPENFPWILSKRVLWSEQLDLHSTSFWSLTAPPFSTTQTKRNTQVFQNLVCHDYTLRIKVGKLPLLERVSTQIYLKNELFIVWLISSSISRDQCLSPQSWYI